MLVRELVDELLKLPQDMQVHRDDNAEGAMGLSEVVVTNFEDHGGGNLWQKYDTSKRPGENWPIVKAAILK